ncbi:MAG: hypothetical protein U5K51_06490 [Flavobacteriaceae bacterium]|nr:hypothetical protein [Flavobacteriaceae bacterium]
MYFCFLQACTYSQENSSYPAITENSDQVAPVKLDGHTLFKVRVFLLHIRLNNALLKLVNALKI